MFLKYIYLCFYINLKYLITHDYIDLTRHFDAFHACYSDDLFIKCLYIDHKIYILFADNNTSRLNLLQFVINWKNIMQAFWSSALQKTWDKRYIFFIFIFENMLRDNVAFMHSRLSWNIYTLLKFLFSAVYLCI